MTEDFKIYIKLAFENNLNFDTTKEAFNLIMNGNVSEIQISSFLSLLQKSGIKSDHVLAALDIMKSKMVTVKSPENSMDTCGTGGDGKNSLNISTATAFVLAAYGIPVAKHGNRALTSKCGSADVLKALNINIDMNTSKLERCIDEVGICFMFAPNHHPAMKYVATVRPQLGIRTIFNILGPLLNPANVNNQLVGVYSNEVFEIYKKVFETSDKNVCLIAGHDGNDEISLEGENQIFTKKNGLIKFDPNTLDFPKFKKEELLGKDSNYNANRILDIFNGKKDSFFDTVCINSAFGVLINNSKDINKVNILKALEDIKLVISDRKPLKLIKKLSEFTNS